MRRAYDALGIAPPGPLITVNRTTHRLGTPGLGVGPPQPNMPGGGVRVAAPPHSQGKKY